MLLDVGDLSAVRRKRKFVADHDDTAVVVVAHGDRVYAMDNVCVHRQRELVRGTILGHRLVCPGHQWAFDLETGWEATVERGQPVYEVRIVDDRVLVDLSSRRVADGPPGDGDGVAVAVTRRVSPDG